MISFMRVWFGTDKFQVSNFKYSGCGIWKAKFEFFFKKSSVATTIAAVAGW